MKKYDKVNALLNCMMAVYRNMEMLTQYVARECGLEALESNFNTSGNVKMKEEQETKKKCSPTPPLQKEEKEKEERIGQPSVVTHTYIGASRFSTSIDERAKTFQESIRPYVDKYGSEVCNEFYVYWAEPTQDGARMRFELEKTWKVGIRLARWKKTEFKGKGSTRKPSPTAPQIADSKALAAQAAERRKGEEARERRAEEFIPRWVYLKLTELQMDVARMTAAEAHRHILQLQADKQLTDEETELLGLWRR